MNICSFTSIDAHYWRSSSQRWLNGMKKTQKCMNEWRKEGWMKCWITKNSSKYKRDVVLFTKTFIWNSTFIVGFFASEFSPQIVYNNEFLHKLLIKFPFKNWKKISQHPPKWNEDVSSFTKTLLNLSNFFISSLKFVKRNKIISIEL